MRHHDIARVGLGLVIAAALFGGCRPRRDFGVASRTFFDRQARAAASGTGQGLDSEEAAAIHQRYRETLGDTARDARQDARSPVLILDEGDRDADRRR